MPDAVFHRLDRDRVVRDLRAHASAVAGDRDDVIAVILIGSLARGDWTAASDADLVVVVDEDARPHRERSAELTPTSVGVSVDVVVHTADELARLSARMAETLREGIVLYESDPGWRTRLPS